MNDLYLLGEVACLDAKRVAVVGTRRASPYGVRITQLFVRALVGSGWVVVSGLARGIDKVAHEAALDAGGKTIAVLGHGLAHTYPSEHKKLRERIVSSGGLIVSSYPEDTPPAPEQFRERNGVMVKLSEAVLVTEAPRKSGTKVTVGFAAEYGRSVYVVPGPVTQASYHGSVEIIRDGGTPVATPEELLGFLENER